MATGFSQIIITPQLNFLLFEKGVQACGTCRGNRVGLPHSVTKPKANAVKQLNRGEAIFRQKGQLTLVTWKDRKPVTVLTTLPVNKEMVAVQRSVKEGNVWQRKEFPCPLPIQQYNAHMGGVDLADQRTTAYARLMKGWTWYMKLFYHVLEVSVLNAYTLYCSYIQDESPKPSMMDFRLNLIKELHGGRSYRKISASPAATQKCRLNLSLGHFPQKVEKRCACKVHVQRVLTCYKCGLCDVYMCPATCFERYHTLQHYLLSDEECSNAAPRLKPVGAGRPHSMGRPRKRKSLSH